MSRNILIVTICFTLSFLMPGCLGFSVIRRTAARTIVGNTITGPSTIPPFATVQGAMTSLVAGGAARMVTTVASSVWGPGFCACEDGRYNNFDGFEGADSTDTATSDEVSRDARSTTPLPKVYPSGAKPSEK
ncbi:MAG: hypothetical protein GF344_01010 [Chitinivibrionales bacterium]|nr:hypothetical protein [Chitinivibrionales bacterium]MBD3355684.1 hypothetical protein [Chitinivibrionales bacterium]